MASGAVELNKRPYSVKRYFASQRLFQRVNSIANIFPVGNAAIVTLNDIITSEITSRKYCQYEY